MTATSDERREVAARLRKASHQDEWLDVAINNAIFDVMGEVRQPIAGTLADLIDPTCGEWRDDPHPIDPAGFTEDDSGLWCEHCDIPLNPDYRYCPYCGSRVVSDDGE